MRKLKISVRHGLILLLTAFACSRLIFFMIDDPEGPNLLVVTAMAVILYALSLAAWFSRPLASLAGFQRIAAVILIQLALSAGFTVLLR
jgi:hypothetical protein